MTTAQQAEGLHTAAGVIPAWNAGYAPTLISLSGKPVIAPYVPNLSPALDAPAPLDPSTGLRFDQVWSGHQQAQIVRQGWHPQDIAYNPSAPDRWPGSPAHLPRLFSGNLGALGGTRQRGFWQDDSRHSNRPHLNPLWALRILNATRTTAPKYNRANAGSGIPAVFVPTSPTNFYRGRASY